jgi:hypothetical protein
MQRCLYFTLVFKMDFSTHLRNPSDVSESILVKFRIDSGRLLEEELAITHRRRHRMKERDHLNL